MIADRICDTVEHNLKNRNDFRNMYAKTEKFENSVNVDSVKVCSWNELEVDNDVTSCYYFLVIFYFERMCTNKIDIDDSLNWCRSCSVA